MICHLFPFSYIYYTDRECFFFFFIHFFDQRSFQVSASKPNLRSCSSILSQYSDPIPLTFCIPDRPAFSRSSAVQILYRCSANRIRLEQGISMRRVVRSISVFIIIIIITTATYAANYNIPSYDSQLLQYLRIVNMRENAHLHAHPFTARTSTPIR